MPLEIDRDGLDSATSYGECTHTLVMFDVRQAFGTLSKYHLHQHPFKCWIPDLPYTGKLVVPFHKYIQHQHPFQVLDTCA